MEQVDVLVVGAGPTGLTAAHLCAAVGLTCTVVERREGPQRSPAAHAVNARSFEIWRQAGVDVDRLRAAAADPAEFGRVHWVTRLGAGSIGSLPYENQGDDMLAVTPTPLRNLSQHRLEPLLVPGDGDVRFGHAWLGAHQDDGGVVARIGGPDDEYEVAARYLLGADGAASPVRRWLGIEPVGPRTIQSFLMVHLRAALRPAVVDDAGVLYFVVDPAVSGVFVAHGPDEWVFMHEWDPDAEPAEAFTPERCEGLVRAALADGVEVEVDVLDNATWHMSAQVAERYRDGRAFLVGDAAHRFPPTGGLGLNTGVADVHNLVWKLAAVEAGWAAPSLLDTYEAERRPVAQFNADQSLANAIKLIDVPVALGASDDVDASVRAMHDRLADPVARAAVEAAIADQATHFDLLGLQLGHRYDDGAVVPDHSAPEPVPHGFDPARHYVPSTRPGGRLPHAWLADGRSTLDLVDPVVPTLLRCGHVPSPLAPAGRGVDDAPVPEADGAAEVEFSGDRAGNGIAANVPPVTASVEPGVWHDDLALADDACLLVRPDQHIAYRGPVDGVGDALDRLFPNRPGTGS